jgi:hypothetical protein
VWRALFVLRCVLRGAGAVLREMRGEDTTQRGLPDEKDDSLSLDDHYSEEFAFVCASADVLETVERENAATSLSFSWRERCARVVDSLAQVLLTLPTVPPLVNKQVVLLIHTLLTHRGVSARKVKRAQNRYTLFKEIFANRSVPQHRVTSRALRIEKAHLLHLRRLSLRSSLSHTLHHDLLEDLITIYLRNHQALNKYTHTRTHT